MIKENTLYFGYGDIAVGSNCFGEITFVNIKPPLKCGQSVDKYIQEGNEIEFGKRISIQVTGLELRNLFRTINENNITFSYKNYIFDFSNYNKESVDVCIRHAQNAFDNILRCLAC